ncbi:MAG: spore cortex biosynthesis protein YabQ [Defluviitaleaceae bacterium]|nr:spore cortex biosynthesis protein YabQ [Defluviitaleaceae bacterium]
MILSVSEQARLFLFACAAGFVIGLVYDAFRIIRLAVPHPSFLIQLEDVLYWALASAGMFIFMQYTTGGEVRAYSIFGTALGALIYFMTLSAFIMAVSTAIINLVKKILAAIITVALIPVRLILHILAIPYGAAKKFLRLAKKPCKKLLQNSLTCAKIGRKKLARDVSIIFRKR